MRHAHVRSKCKHGSEVHDGRRDVTLHARGVRAPRVRQKRDDDESKADETRSGRPENDVEVVPSLQCFHTSPRCLWGERVLGWHIDHNGLWIDSVSRPGGSPGLRAERDADNAQSAYGGTQGGIGKRTIMATLIRAIKADITTLTVDAIVNAANSTLLGGGGVDGAIHDAAGPGLLEECKLLGGCTIGDARITRAYRLNSKHIIHAVGPVWRGGLKGERELLASCYERSLQLAARHSLRSIAFPSISTGAFGFPLDLAAPIAVRVVREFTAQMEGIDQVIFCCFSRDDLSTYTGVLRVSGG
jgi:O-acetyl-ADP-ribose deacetylase